MARQYRATGVGVGLMFAGAAALASQVLLLREFLNVLGGNELVVGVVLASWLLLTGAGALAGQYAGTLTRPRLWLGALLVAAGLLLPAQMALIRLLKSQLPPGVAPDLGQAVACSLSVLLPICAIGGFLVPLCARLLRMSGADASPGRSYLLDTAGAAIGGLLCTLLVSRLNAFDAAAIVLGINLAAAASVALDPPRRRAPAIALLCAAVGLPALLMSRPFDAITAQWMFPGQELIWQKDTPYGHLATTQAGRQITIHQNGLPAASNDEPIAAEELVHYALAQRPSPRDVLLLSGGLQGAPREALKYPDARVTLVELDPAILELAAPDPRVRCLATDPRRFLRAHVSAFDAILCATPDPLSLQANRFFTIEFFREARRALRPGGVLGLSVAGGENLTTHWDQKALASIAHALGAAFPHVIAIPGARVRFVASDAPLTLRVDDAVAARGIPTAYVNAAWLSDRLAPERVAALNRVLASPAAANGDFLPVAFSAKIRQWLGLGGTAPWLPAGLAALLLAAIVVPVAALRERAVGAAVGASGFAGMGLEVVTLLAFQAVFGSLYEHIGLILAAFLGGAALGAWRGCLPSPAPLARLLRLDAALALLAFLTPPALGLLHAHLPAGIPAGLAAAPFALLTAMAGFLVGAQFQPAVRVIQGSGAISDAAAAGRLYGLDLLGGSLGAMAGGALLIPLLGVTASCYLIGGIKLATTAALGLRMLAPARAGAHEAALRPGTGFAAMLASVAIAGALIAWEETSAAVGAIAESRLYHGLALALLAWAFLDAMGVLRGDDARPRPGLLWLARPAVSRWIQFLGLGLVAFYPLFRCFFKVPYLFCHVCPRQCVFGYFRPYLVPAALLMNLRARHWCHHTCPVGSLLQCQGGSRRAPRWLLGLAIAAASFAAVAWFRMRSDAALAPAGGGPWFQFFFKNAFTASATVLAVAAAVVGLGSLWRRAFCSGLCPIGGVSELLLRLEKWWNERNRRQHPQGP